jgi:hypothetical protein
MPEWMEICADASKLALRTRVGSRGRERLYYVYFPNKRRRTFGTLTALAQFLLEYKPRPCGNPDCSVSTHVFEGLTFGSGGITEHGFWENPLRYMCPCS